MYDMQKSSTEPPNAPAHRRRAKGVRLPTEGAIPAFGAAGLLGKPKVTLLIDCANHSACYRPVCLRI